ncbi:Ribosomal lysine N-methyltransferase 4 [Sphaceloma murrayae]|uniref:Ribosomal lysine N-methyltransferase 4 n=1 Tax=Sphaceloma murrayae TaxID=2082308 RepID=A0A2K1QJY7_9PEZI|nr:Ribosomal lysine N-methyltransferase 4 [Sphaceloma murrayae]
MDTSMTEDDDFSINTSNFLHFFTTSQPFLSDKVELADLRKDGRGRGVIAKADVEEDEDLFSLHRDGILSVENSALVKDEAGSKVLADLDDPWLSLILVLIHERDRPASPWKDYINVLRDSDLDTLMFWEEPDLAELQASAIRNKIGRVGADGTFKSKLIPAIKANTNLFPNAGAMGDEQLLALAHWAGSTIMAYAFDIEKQPSAQTKDEEGYVSDEEEEYLPKGLVPMADMLNADADRNNARLFYEEDTVVMRAIKPVKAGEELFNDYGPLPRADLLRRYGYITENYAKYDVVELSTEFIIETVRSGLTPTDRKHLEGSLAGIEEALEERGYWDDAYIVSAFTEDDEDPLFPPGLQMLLYRLTTLGRTKFAKRPEVIDKEDQGRMRQSYVDVLKARLAQYETSIEEDQDSLRRLGLHQSGTNDQNPGTIRSSRHAKAVHVRLGEKLLLQQAISHVSIDSLRPTNGSSRPEERVGGEEGRPNKRTKLSNGS